jgi:hypothetical protein
LEFEAAKAPAKIDPTRWFRDDPGRSFFRRLRLDDCQRHHARVEAAEFTGPLTGVEQLFEVRGAPHRDLNEGDQWLPIGADEFQTGFDLGAQSSGR